MATLLSWINAASIAALSAGSEAAGLDVNNLQNDRGSPSTAWQTLAGDVTPADGAWLLIDSFVTSTVWRAFGAFRTNFTPGALIRVRVGNARSGAQITTPYAYDSGTRAAGITKGFGQSVLVAGVDVTGRYCQIDFSDVGNPDGFLNIPLVCAGPAYFPSTGITFDSTHGSDDQTDEVVSQGGQEYPTMRWQRRRWTIAFDGIKRSEIWSSVSDLDRTARLGGNVLFVPDTTSPYLTQESVFGRLKATADITYPARNADIRAWRAQITERI